MTEDANVPEKALDEKGALIVSSTVPPIGLVEAEELTRAPIPTGTFCAHDTFEEINRIAAKAPEQVKLAFVLIASPAAVGLPISVKPSRTKCEPPGHTSSFINPFEKSKNFLKKF
jgi:hypothetical protein